MFKTSLEIAWIKRSVIDKMSLEAERCQPYETGGCLLGYWVRPSYEVVITHSVGPGPDAEHSKRRFWPDHEWQTSVISEIYRKSRYSSTYLGDWHTHPQSPNSGLSWRDHRTLRKIASYPPARASMPVMAIIAGGSPWTIRIWYLELKSFKIFSIGRKKEILQFKIYDQEL